MEFNVIKRLFEDKQIVNPINPEEVFTCKDLVDGKLPHPANPFFSNLNPFHNFIMSVQKLT